MSEDIKLEFAREYWEYCPITKHKVRIREYHGERVTIVQPKPVPSGGGVIKG